MRKLALLSLAVTFLFCYMEWPPDNHFFIFQILYGLLFEYGKGASSYAHPFVILPLVGQLLAIVALFLPNPKRWLVLTAIICMGVLALMLLLVGALSLNWKMLLATLPFFASVVWCWRLFIRKKF